MIKKYKINILKLINFLMFIKGLFFYLFKVRDRSFKKLPTDIIDIGSFDQSLLIHTPKKYKNYFNSDNLPINTHYNPYKTDTIGLVLVGEKVLIKKTYKGNLKKRVKFYNEIICLKRMSFLKNTPKIHYVDYDSLTIYLQYLQGDCLLRKIRKTGRGYEESESKFVKHCCKVALKKIHKNNIAVIDVGSRNIIYDQKEHDVYFIDFADSICGGLIPRRFMKFLQRRDEIKLSEAVLSKL